MDRRVSNRLYLTAGGRKDNLSHEFAVDLVMRANTSMLFRGVFMIVMSALSLAGCKKEQPATNGPITITEALKAGRFQLYKMILEYPIGTPNDFTGTKTCELNDVLEFEAGGGFNYYNQKECFPVNNSLFLLFNGGSWTVTDSTLILNHGYLTGVFHLGVITRMSIELTRKDKNYFQEDEEYRYFFKPAN